MILAILLSLAIAIFRGGRIFLLAQTSFRFPLLILFGLGLQLAIFSPWWPATLYESIGFLYLVALSTLLSAVFFNRHLPGLKILGLGLASNFIVIAANGGVMPTSLEAVRQAEMPDVLLALETEGRYRHSVPLTEDSRLPFLGDIFGVAYPLPAPRVFSIGDVFVAAGAFWFVQEAMLGRARAQP
ncbi:MAG: DUF5317 domain-containing protein [Chloroflexi bacterium]|nr:DUF5317 domain-containing protein [Chloroflexota bacterium]